MRSMTAAYQAVTELGMNNPQGAACGTAGSQVIFEKVRPLWGVRSTMIRGDEDCGGQEE